MVKISDRDMQHCHFLKSTCDIGDPPSRAPGMAVIQNGRGGGGEASEVLRLQKKEGGGGRTCFSHAEGGGGTHKF